MTSALNESGLENISVSDDVLFLTPEEEHSNHQKKEDDYDDDEAHTHKTLNQISIVAGNEFDLHDEPVFNTNESVSRNQNEKNEHKNSFNDECSSPVSFDSLSALNAIELNVSKSDDLHNHSNNNDASSFNTTNNESLNDMNQLNVSNDLIDESIRNDMNKYLFKNTRYFLIKSNNHENVNLAKLKVIII